MTKHFILGFNSKNKAQEFTEYEDDNGTKVPTSFLISTNENTPESLIAASENDILETEVATEIIN